MLRKTDKDKWVRREKPSSARKEQKEKTITPLRAKLAAAKI